MANDWTLHGVWPIYQGFEAGAAEGSWEVDWALHDSPLPLIGWAVGAPPAPSIVTLLLMGVG